MPRPAEATASMRREEAFLISLNPSGTSVSHLLNSKTPLSILLSSSGQSRNIFSCNVKEYDGWTWIGSSKKCDVVVLPILNRHFT